MIDSRAVISTGAKLGENVKVGPWSVIGENVEIGDGTVIGPHVVINGPTKIGRNNRIYQFSSLGEAPQCINYDGEETTLEIGDDNIIREFCTFSRGTVQGNSITRIGSRNFIMAYVHVAHDCSVGSDIIFANNAALSGHVVVEDFSGFGGFSVVRQFCRVGAYSFVAGETSVVKDVPPYVLVSGHPASVYGLNVVGLKRRGFSDKTMAALRKSYNVIYRKGLTIQDAMNELEKLAEESSKVKLFIKALQNSTRGIVR